ncbi:MAG: efflux RND transporter permease subunit, partial [Lysobacterales bacterium]
MAGSNVVEVGKRIEQRLAEVMAELPIGIETHKIAWQADQVEESIVGFLVNLVEAVLIVLAVLWLTMGLRMAVIIGIGGLVFTIIGTLLIMFIWGIDLQRMSLGALIIAMGMMVDNAIVIADGISVRIQQGMDRTKAAIEAASLPATPLLGATVIAVMAFYPIYAATSDVGEYCGSLFQVVGASLLLSWVLSVTIVPLLCIALLPEPEAGGAQDQYGGRFYTVFSGLLGSAIRFKWPFMVIMIGLFVMSVFSFQYVNQMFFPDSSRPQLMIDYWAPQGTRIQQVKADVRAIEQKLIDHPLVESVSTFVGQGPPRFYLPVEPEMPYPEYAELVVNFRDYHDVQTLAVEIEPWLTANVPQALVRVRKFGVGPSDTWQIEALFSGPANADLGTLRNLAQQGVAILEANPLAREVRTNMR